MSKTRPIIEICVDSLEHALTAQELRADRIELCSNLDVGGVTPSAGLIHEACAKLDIPVFVMIRPRSGNFIYNQDELAVMRADIEQAKVLGAAGVVFGVLNQDRSINAEITQELIQLARPLKVTFHRAFDYTPDPVQSLKALDSLGVNWLLTSGQQESAEAGLDLITTLSKIERKHTHILAGSGINPGNANFMARSGVQGIHFTSRKLIQQVGSEALNMGKGSLNEWYSYSFDSDKTKAIVQALEG